MPRQLASKSAPTPSRSWWKVEHVTKVKMGKAPLVLEGVRKLYCYNPDCPYAKKKGWVFGTVRMKSERGPFACKHCGEELEQRCSIHDAD